MYLLVNSGIHDEFQASQSYIEPVTKNERQKHENTVLKQLIFPFLEVCVPRNTHSPPPSLPIQDES